MYTKRNRMETRMKKIAIITGASSGMGMEMSRQINDLIPAIDEIWIIARRKDRLVELSKRLDTSCVIIEADLMDSDFYKKYQEMLENEKAHVKLLVNAAGYGMMGNISELPLEENTGMVRLNCEALTAITRITLPYMMKKSRIINFASSAAFLPQPGFAVYAATKSYVLSFSRALNQELRKRQIYVTAVCPGPVATEFFTKAEQTHKRAWYKELFMSDCRRVVYKALNDSINRKQVSIYGLPMNALYIATKFIPMRLMLAFVGIMNHEEDSCE